MSQCLVSNHAPKRQAIYNTKNIQTSRSKSRGYPNSHIVNQTITMTDKVFSRPTWLEVHTYCIKVHHVKVCKRAHAKVLGHRVIQNHNLCNSSMWASKLSTIANPRNACQYGGNVGTSACASRNTPNSTVLPNKNRNRCSYAKVMWFSTSLCRQYAKQNKPM